MKQARTSKSPNPRVPLNDKNALKNLISSHIVGINNPTRESIYGSFSKPGSNQSS